MAYKHILYTFVIVLLWTVTVAAKPVLTEKNVLLLNSYHPGLSWTDDITSAIKQMFQASGQPIQLQVEYLDTKRYQGSTYLDQYLTDYFSYKLKQIDFDLVIVSDNDAYNFALKHRDDFFAGKPVVFCGVNGFLPVQIATREDITGVAETPDLQETLALARKLHPHVKELIVVGTTSDLTGQQNFAQFTKTESLFPDLEFTYLNDLDMETLLERVPALKSHQLLFISSTIKGRNGRLFGFKETAAMLRKASPVPIYGSWDFFLGHGIVGGKLINGRAQGKKAAQFAVQILNGTDPDEIPVVSTAGTRFMFDYEELKRFAIDLDQLPAESVVINQPQSFYSIGKITVWGSIAAAVLLALISLILIRQMLLLKKSGIALSSSESRFRLLIEQAPEAITVYDVDLDCFVDCNTNATKLFGCSREEFLQGGPRRFYTPEQPDGLPSAVSIANYNQRALAGKVVLFERTILKADGEKISCEVRLVQLPAENRRLMRASFFDITERKQAEKKLRDSELRYRLLADHNFDWEYWLNSEGEYVYVSPSCERISGYSPEEFESNPQLLLNLTKHAHKGQVHQHYENEKDKNAPAFTMEFQIIAKNGEERWLEHHCTPVFDEEGNYAGRRGTNRDITQRKQAEKEQRQSEQRFRKLSSLTFEGIVIHDKGVMIDVNQSLANMFGYASEELIGQNAIELLFPREYHLILYENIAKSVASPYEVVGRKKDGTRIPIEVESRDVKNKDEHFRVTALRDISEKKRAEETLFESEQKLRRVLDNAPVHMWAFDGVRYIYVNRAWFDYTGQDQSEELTVDLWMERIHPDDAEQSGKIWQDAWQRKIEHLNYFRLKNKDGDYRSFACHTFPVLSNEGEFLYFQGFNIDITDRVASEKENLELQKRLQQSLKMEAIGTMAGGIAHDFNNLLAIITGNTEMIQRKLKNGNPPEKNIEHIKDATSRAIDLVKQILAFSRQEKQNLAPVDLSIAVDDALKLMRSTTPTSVEIMLPTYKKSIFISADTTQLQQIFINLCTNAIHAMNEKGLLNVAVDEVELAAAEISSETSQKAGKYAKLSIADTGMGMDKETLDKIFDPFFTTKDIGKGTGMGLSMVHGIVEQHGGFITIESTLGQGTTFNIYFPSLEKPEIETTTESKKLLPVGTERILFVDDEEQVASMCNELLKAQGYKVTSITNSITALDIFKANPDGFDLVVTDQTMPEMTGAELATEILNVRPDIPIILCSGFSAKVAEKDAKDLGIRKFCMKPMTAEQLTTAVRDVLDEAEA